MKNTQRAKLAQETRTEQGQLSHRGSSSSSSPLGRVPGYLSVKEAANQLGLSLRTVYGYLENGRLAGAYIGDLRVVSAEAVATFERRSPGRARTRTPQWRVAPEKNRFSLMTITVRLRPGQRERFQSQMQEMRRTNIHCLPGTTARYMVRNLIDPEEIDLVLLWRASIVSTEEQRRAALEALAVDFKDIVDWDHARVKEGEVVLHAC